jgi:glycosidase
VSDGGHVWWEDAVVYEVYPRSFADADGDGVGDLPGLRSRLGYLADLGVDAVWLTPFYPSPLADGGYDVSDYCAVDPLLGTMTDFDHLVKDAAAHQIRVIVDLVPNHCSSAHPLFRAALAAAPGSPERARFIFRDGRGPGGEQPPNNWVSQFGGPAWTRVTEADGRPGQWYLHVFDISQPDWDWRNPDVPALFEDVIRFWLDRDVAGLRVDVAHGLFKDPDLPDIAGRRPLNAPSPYRHRPELQPLYRSWRAILDSYPADGWVRTGRGFGFSRTEDGASPSQPWLPQPPDWGRYSVESQLSDERSFLSLYRAALRLRREHPALGRGTPRWLDAEGLLCFARDPGFILAANLGAAPAPLPAHREILLASAPVTNGSLPPDTAAWLSS